MTGNLTPIPKTLVRLPFLCLVLGVAVQAAAFEIEIPGISPFVPVTVPTPPSGSVSAVLKASTRTVRKNEAFTLTWNATNATNCVASGGWQGNLPTSGTRVFPALYQRTYYSISCSGPGGTAISSTSIGLLTALRLRWAPPTRNEDGSALSDLAGYRLYWGTEPRTYSNQMNVGNPLRKSRLVNLRSGTYYFAMTAIDADGNESRLSNEVIRIVP